MTEKEMRKLSRADLLELLIAQMKENRRLQALLDEKEEQLHSRTIAIENAGSIAEASLMLNRVFSSAQAAADQYLENIRQMQREAERRYHRMPAEWNHPEDANGERDEDRPHIIRNTGFPNRREAEKQ